VDGLPNKRRTWCAIGRRAATSFTRSRDPIFVPVVQPVCLSVHRDRAEPTAPGAGSSHSVEKTTTGTTKGTQMNDKGRISAAVLVAVGATALLAGCGFESGGQAAPTTTTVVETEQAPAEEPTEEPAEQDVAASDDLASCTADVVEPELDAGQVPPEQESWDTTLAVTNVGTADCRLEGVSEVTFFAETGAPIDRAQRTPEGDGPVNDLVVVAPGERAELYIHYGSAPQDTASGHCPSPTLMEVVLPGDSQPLEVALPADTYSMPPLCGEEMQVTPWTASIG
jgi:hypothetical protein